MKFRSTLHSLAVTAVLIGLLNSHSATALVDENPLALASPLPATDVSTVSAGSSANADPLPAPASAVSPTAPRPQSGLQLRVGRQRIEQSGALFSNSYDNARVVGINDVAERYQLKMFGYRTPSAIRDDGTNLYFTPDKANAGASLQIDDIEHWSVRSALFSSTDNEGRIGGSDAPDVGVWNLSANRRWLDRSIETRIEYARTGATFDDTRSLADDALDIHIDLHSMAWLPLPAFADWTAGLHCRSIGNEFYSSPEAYLPNGLDQASLFLQSSTERLDVNVGWQTESQARVEWLGMLPRSQQRSTLALTYRPVLDESSLVRTLLGTPSLTTHFHAIDQFEPGYDPGSGQLPLMSDGSEQGVMLAFEQPGYEWQLRYQQIDQQRRVNAHATNGASAIVPNLTSNATSLSLTLTPAEMLLINFDAQWNRLQAQQHDGLTHTRDASLNHLYGLAAQLAIRPNISMVLRYDYARNYSSAFDTGTDFASQMRSAEISWRAMSFDADRPALDLKLKGSYGIFSDHLVGDLQDRWSAQLSVSFTWASQPL